MEKSRVVENYIAAQVEADVKRVELDRTRSSFSMNSYCRENKIDRTRLIDWINQYKAGMYSLQFFENIEEYEEYMGKKEVTRTPQFFLQIINQKLAEKFPLLSEYLSVSSVEGLMGPYGLVARKDWVEEKGTVVGEYLGLLVQVPKGEVWKGRHAYICDFSLAANIEAGRTFIDAMDFFSCYFRYANHPPKGESNQLYFSERVNFRIVICLNEPIQWMSPVYLNYGTEYFDCENLHKNDMNRRYYNALQAEAVLRREQESDKENIF